MFLGDWMLLSVLVSVPLIFTTEAFPEAHLAKQVAEKNLLRKLRAFEKFSSPVWQMQEFLIIIKELDAFWSLSEPNRTSGPSEVCPTLNRLQPVIVSHFESDFLCCAQSSSQWSEETTFQCPLTHTHMFAFSASAVWSSTTDSTQIQQ